MLQSLCKKNSGDIQFQTANEDDVLLITCAEDKNIMTKCLSPGKTKTFSTEIRGYCVGRPVALSVPKLSFAWENGNHTLHMFGQSQCNGKRLFCVSKSRMTTSSPVWEWELVWSRDQWDLPCGTTSYRGRQYLGGARRRRQMPWQSEIRVMKTYFFNLGLSGRFHGERYVAT